MLLGFDSEFKTDKTFWDKVEDLPGCFIIQREIEKAVSGKPFFINDEETKKPIRLECISQIEFYYYYQIWEDYHYFGLPNGNGTAKERRWLLDLLKIFEKTHKQVKKFIEYKMSRKPDNG